MEEAEKPENESVQKDGGSPTSQGKSCALCGCSTPAVRCDRCSSQIFCLSCDDMYHRHPKRRLHLRKAVDSIWNSSRSPRLRRRTDLPGDPSKIPIPPPRSKKRERHAIGGRIFLKTGLELGSFGHSKMFDMKNLTPTIKDISAGQKPSPSSMEVNYENGANMQIIQNENEPNELYENGNVAINQDENLDNSSNMEKSPWNVPRPNISSPIQVSIPSNSPDLLANGQSFGYPTKPQSHSINDISTAATNQIGPHSYHFPHPYPYMHPPVHPPYSHSMAHLNCAQCVSSSWSNLTSPHPSPYFHPMPWGSAQSTLARGHQMHGSNGHMKHSHGDLITYPDSNFPYPYPGGAFYYNGPPVVDPNFIKDLHQQADMHKVKRSPSSRQHRSNEDMDAINDTDDTAIASNSAVNEPAVQESQANNEAAPKVPVNHTEPWSCVHCTFINPPGIFICQVCCKTSYGANSSNDSESQNESRAMINRDSESPMELVNNDALLTPVEFSELKGTQKVI